MSYLSDKPKSKWLKDDYINAYEYVYNENNDLNKENRSLRNENSRLDNNIKDLTRLVKISEDNGILAEQYLQLKDQFDVDVSSAISELTDAYNNQKQANSVFITKVKIISAVLLFISTISTTAAVYFALNSNNITDEFNKLNSKYTQNMSSYNVCESDLYSLKNHLNTCNENLNNKSTELYNKNNELKECLKKTKTTIKKKK